MFKSRIALFSEAPALATAFVVEQNAKLERERSTAVDLYDIRYDEEKASWYSGKCKIVSDSLDDLIRTLKASTNIGE